MRGEGVSLVEDGLLAEDVRKTSDASGADDGATDQAAAIGERGDGLLDIGEVAIACRSYGRVCRWRRRRGRRTGSGGRHR